MAKRFSDSNKWSKPFIRSMKAPYKLLWLFILDECDHAGIWQVDFQTAQIKTGEKLNINEAIRVLGNKIVQVDNGEKWFIVDFVDFQYGQLQSNNRVHHSVINILNKYGLIDENLNIKNQENKGLISPLQGDKDKDMDKDKDKDKDKDPPKPKKKNKHPFSESDIFDKQKFKEMLEASPIPYCNADPNHYYESAKNGSDSKGYLYLDWAAAIKNWIRSDDSKGSLVRKQLPQNQNITPGMLQNITGII